MKKNSHSFVLLLLIFAFIFVPFVSSAEPIKLDFQYSCIKDFGTIADIQKKAGADDIVVESADKQNAYLVRTVSVKSEAHLLQLMGADDESKLTDLQKGLLETYRFTGKGELDNFAREYPGATGNIDVDLVDINGFTDKSRFPNIEKDFWPINSRYWTRNGDEFRLDSRIRISGTDCLGYGPAAAEAMKGTFTHEFGHSLDLTNSEAKNPYGKDGSHYLNEKIDSAASFAEGWANFIKWLFSPSKEEEEKNLRNSLKTIKIERPEGGYDEYKISDGMLNGEEYLDVEAINALIFTKLSSELPHGKIKVFASFAKHNKSKNRMALFLQNFIKDYPQYARETAQILNRETFGNLKDDDFRKILGYNSDVEKYLAERQQDNIAIEQPVKEPEPVKTVREAPSYPAGTVFKWKDSRGNLHFTDRPPPEGYEFTVMSPEPDHGNAPVVENVGDNPFDFR